MKAAAFDYYAPTTIDEAVSLLAIHGEDARILAGGQSLVAAMTARLARPAHLIDINGIAEAELSTVSGGALHIPPLMRHVDFETPVVDGALGALLARLAGALGTLPVRMRGTFCGALAQGDPAAEWCLAAVTLNANIVLRSDARGRRTVKAADFFETMLTTVAADDEMIVEVAIPMIAGTARTGFAKVARRSGDYGEALALVMADIENGLMTGVRIGVGAVEAVPRRITEAETVLEGKVQTERLLREAAEAAAEAVVLIETDDDSQAYQRDITHAAVFRALKETRR